MKKIKLAKETLRVLTAQESDVVAGGLPVTTVSIEPQARCPEPSVRCTVGCPTAGCPTNGCPPNTANCPPQTGRPCLTTNPTRGVAKCFACPVDPL